MKNKVLSMLFGGAIIGLVTAIVLSVTDWSDPTAIAIGVLLIEIIVGIGVAKLFL